MRGQLGAYRGGMLGMAVGDAMGYSVDTMSLAEIRQTYGPNGLQGYDLVNGYADVTSNTQLAAFTANGLLLAVTRGQLQGKMAPFVKYVGLACREWMTSQRTWGKPERSFCWLLQQPEICRRRCMDTRMLDILNHDPLGTIEDPVNNLITPGSLACAIGVGLFHDLDRMQQEELDLLGAESVALTHGGALAFLSGAALTHLISRCLTHPNVPLKKLVLETAQSIRRQFGARYSQCYELVNLLHMAVSLAGNENFTAADVMERIHCESCAQVLAGAVYACLYGREEFDTCMIAAVNHSGRSAAVGAIAGAILGLRHQEKMLPDFYLEGLEPAEILRELADDLYHGCPMEKGKKIFDLDWDQKYVHSF